jgi:DNA-binding response OmpR family regulator
MHILLIEPDTILAQLYIQALENAGHTVSFVRSADAAIHTADRKIPDVVVLEIQLTSHSGVAFLQEFRSYSDWLDIPVLLHTLIPPASLQHFQKALDEMGVVARLYKPQTTLRQLVNAVDACAPVPL